MREVASPRGVGREGFFFFARTRLHGEKRISARLHYECQGNYAHKEHDITTHVWY
jgi:hypothetical protein